MNSSDIGRVVIFLFVSSIEVGGYFTLRLDEICSNEMDIFDKYSEPEKFLEMTTELKYFPFERGCLLRYYLLKKNGKLKEDSLVSVTLLYEIISQNMLPHGIKELSTHKFVADIINFKSSLQRNYADVLNLLKDNPVHGYARVIVDTMALKALLEWIPHQHTEYTMKYIDDSEDYAKDCDLDYMWTLSKHGKISACFLFPCILLIITVGFFCSIIIQMPGRRTVLRTEVVSAGAPRHSKF